ncbi:MAG: carboxypeptidase-like regulatory domain-containing protein [Bacteroidota bacterium]
MKKLGCFLLILLIFSPLAQSQKTITGTIENSEMDAPVEFANVFLQSNQSRGVLSNQEGKFSFRLYANELQDTLVISRLGYSTIFLPIEELEEEIVVQLKENIFSLDAITVLSKDGIVDIFKRAVNKIPSNYGSSKYFLKGFYQDYTISDGAYAELIECFINIKDKTYSNPKYKSKMWLKEMRRSDDQKNLPPRIEKFVTGRNSIYPLYELWNSTRSRRFHFFFKPASMYDKYAFYNLGEYSENGDTLLKIGYQMKQFSDRTENNGFATGEVIIRKSDSAFLKVTSGDPSAGSYKISTYHKVGNKYYPRSIEWFSQFKYNQKTRTFARKSALYFFDTTDKIAGNKGKRMNREKDLRDFNYTYKEAFWRNNEVLLNVDAPKALSSDLGRTKDLSKQFEENQRKRKKIE